MKDIYYEKIEKNGVVFAEIIYANSSTPITKFVSDDKQSLQFGLLAHEAGFIEAPHYHKPIKRVINNLEQMFVVQRGKIKITFFDLNDGNKAFRNVILNVGDAINLVDGGHSLEVLESMQCISVKQGPFMGDANDKIEF